MALANSTLITVTATYTRLDGRAASGQVFFSSNQVLVNSTSGEIVPPVDFVATLDANGAISIDLPATDDPDYEPQGWTYTVTEDTDGGDRPPFGLSVPADGGSIDLADVAPPGPTESLTADEYTLLSTFTSHRSAWGGDPPAGSADDLIGLDANNVPKAIPRGAYRRVTVRANGPNDSIVTRVNDALTAAGEGAHVWIEGDEGLIDAPIVLQNRYQRVEVSGETVLWVPSGYAQPAFQMYSTGGANTYHMSIALWGVLREKDDTSLAYNWIAFEILSDGGTILYPRIDTGPFVWYPGVGLKLRLNGSGTAITGGRFGATFQNPQVGTAFELTNSPPSPDIGRNYFDMVQTQWSGQTTYGVKNVLGKGNVFVCPVMWDTSNNVGSTPFEVGSQATDTLIVGADPNLADGGLVDNGVNTVVVSPAMATFPQENQRINLSGAAMRATMGSPTPTTTAFRYLTWGLADSANQGVSGHLDDDGVSHGSRTMRVYLMMSNADGNTGIVNLNARVQQTHTNLADGAWPNHDETSLSVDVDLPDDGRPQLIDMGTFELLTGPRELNVQVFRQPGAANDDLVGSVYFWKAKFERE